MRLIVGLGNPGREYVKTRHNVGFRVVERLAEKLGSSFDRNKFKGEYASAEVSLKGGGEEKLLLVKPQTYMNLSGETVLGFSGYFKIALNDLLVACDDVALPVGALRLRSGGSDGGHNGLKDIALRLGSKEYARLRIGVGGREENAQARPDDLASHVLGRFSAAEEEILKDSVAQACEACLYWVENGMEAAMNRYNKRASRGSDKGE